jgi:hypothetical protein
MGRRSARSAIAVHRVAADGITSEQAVDEAIARVKQLGCRQAALIHLWPFFP